MAATLVNVALSSIRKAHATYYGDVDDNNPVIVAVKSELNEYCNFMAKVCSGNYTKPSNQGISRPSNWLYDIWNKYEPRLPEEFYKCKLIEIGDYLLSLRAYDIAYRQCYNRFLVTFLKASVEDEFKNAKHFSSVFFSDQLSKPNENNNYICKVILGSLTCQFYTIQSSDNDFSRPDSIQKCMGVLKKLQMFMQAIQPYEFLCWMLYNCTVIMYQFCRNLMASGNTKMVLEFLIWAAMCMEASVPLLAVKYLTWRVTLYTAVCYAYYDCKAGEHAENFARRSLNKIQELSDLEFLSKSSTSDARRVIFQQATVKMACMVFKRSVFETRKRPKGLLRPKQKNNLREAAQHLWPRTGTEKLLCDMFEGTGAQFLAILEALTNTNVRVFGGQSMSAEVESEVVDVFAELFFAGKEIIAGGGKEKSPLASGADHSVLAGIRTDKSLVQIAAAGENGVSLISVIRFIKLAFCYEQWDIFSALLDSALLHIKKASDQEIQPKNDEQDQNQGHSAPELCLALMLVMERVVKSNKTSKKNLAADVGSEVFPPTQGSVRSHVSNDDLQNLAETVLFCVGDSSMFLPQGKDGEIILDRDMVIDACLLLWKKCKAVFSKSHLLSNLDKSLAHKWLRILQVVHTCFTWCQFAFIDPVTAAEISLQLALCYENDFFDDAELHGGASKMSVASSSYVMQTKPDRYNLALKILQDALTSIGESQSLKMNFNGSEVSDTSWMKNEGMSFTQSNMLTRDLYVELLSVHHRIAVKLMDTIKSEQPTTKGVLRTSSSVSFTKPNDSESTSLKFVNDFVGESLVSGALMKMQKALQKFESGKNQNVTLLLEQATTMLLKAQEEEKHLYLVTQEKKATALRKPLPSAPILLARSQTSMIFKPASFNSSTPVAWYRIFGRLAAGSNVKVRVNDYFLTGTGNEIPANKNTVFTVKGLKPFRKYVFAVAAYAEDGTIIGGSIGDTSNVILAQSPTSILMAWALLSETAHKVLCNKVASFASQILWEHFVDNSEVDDENSWTTSANQDFKLTLYHLDKNCLSSKSSVLLRHVAVAWLIYVQESVSTDGLVCTKLCNKGQLLPSQVRRLLQCERALVTMDLAGYLNDESYLLQATTQCFGLLAPIIQVDIYSHPVVQILLRCHVALREACASARSQRSPMTNDSIHHMIASITYHVARVLRTWGQSEKCLNVIDSGKYLLNSATASGSGEKIDEMQTKKSNRLKPLPTNNASMSHELSALEERLSALSKEQRAADELSGNEDYVTVLTYILAAKPLVAYKEVAKFRRRHRFLEFYVHIMLKALRSKHIEAGVEWSQEVLSWLRKRNESLYVNYSLVSSNNGGIVVKGEDPSKYAAALASYGQDAKTRKKKEKDRKKKRLLMPRRSGGVELNELQEEAERKALFKLEKNFPEMYKNNQKRLKLRKITNDEMPWRAEFNHLISLFHMDMFLERIAKRRQMLSSSVLESRSTSLIDHKLWSLNAANVMVNQPYNTFPIVNVDGQPVEDDEDEMGSGKALLNAARRAVNSVLGLDPSAQAINQEMDENKDTPRTQRTNSPTSMTSTHTVDPEVVSVQSSAIKDIIRVVILSYRRALVLSHRGKHWTLLQNISRSLFSSLAVLYEETINTKEPLITIPEFRKMTLVPVSFAADFLLDMLLHYQKPMEEESDWTVGSYVGNIQSEKGGASLSFEDSVDDVSMLDMALIKALVFKSIEMLHYELRYEKLVDFCLRFNALSHDRFAESLHPIMIHAQHCLTARVKESGGSTNPLFVASSDGEISNLNNRNYITSQLQLKLQAPFSASTVNVGGFIDPAAHDVYSGGKRALALSCVPIDTANSLYNFYQAINKCKYVSRALMHSRKLLSLHVASQQDTKLRSTLHSAATTDGRSSSVNFVNNHTKNLLPTPPDYTYCDFATLDEVEIMPISHIPTVIESYNRTMELLVSHGQYDLVAQASHELGNLEYHRGNIKAAGKMWDHSLDQIFRTNNTIQCWRTFTDEADMPSFLINKLGIWGCLLAIVVLSKLGEFYYSEVKDKAECALFASGIIRALFRSSLPHPTCDHEYALYEIIPIQVYNTSVKPSQFTPGASAFIPDIDLFSDPYRCEVKSLTNSVHWICQTLVELEFNVKSLPCLTLYQYLASFVCKDINRSVVARCMKVDALTKMQIFSAALNEIFVLLYGTRIPHPTAVGFLDADSVKPNAIFDETKQLDNLNNLKVLETVASKRISASLFEIYGPQLTCEITLHQANLILEISSFINCLPQRPSYQDLLLISPEAQLENDPVPLNAPRPPQNSVKSVPDDVRSTISALSTASAHRQIKRMFSKRDVPLSPGLLKGMLIHVAESLIIALGTPLKQSDAKPNPSELWIEVNCNLLLIKIHTQRQHATLAAADALEALRLMEDADILDEAEMFNLKRIYSAFKKGTQGSNNRGASRRLAYYENIVESLFRTRINARLWLKVRYELCVALSVNIVGLGSSISASGSSMLQLHCAEGLAEAEACEDVEMQAKFLFEGARIDGVSTDECRKMLDDAMSVLNSLYELSDIGNHCLVSCSVLFTDIQLNIKEWTPQRALQQYNSVHASLLIDEMQHGEVIKHTKNEPSSLVMPLNNIYHKTLHKLSHVKLRIGKASYTNLDETASGENWHSALAVVSQAKIFCESAAINDPALLAEVCLELGKIQQNLYKKGMESSENALSSLQSAIKLTHPSEPSIRRLAYLEKALLSIDLNDNTTNKAQLHSITDSLFNAFTLANNLKNRTQLPGNIDVTTASFTDNHKTKLPDFVVLDMESSFDSIPLPVTTDDITIDPVIMSIHMAAEEFSWIHILHYKVLLHRKLLLSNIKEEEQQLRPDTDDSNVSSEYYPDGKQDNIKASVLSSMFGQNFTLRIQALHEYLESNLKPYADTCSLKPLKTGELVLVLQIHKLKSKTVLLWCNTKTKQCDKVLVATHELASLVTQIKLVLQKVEIFFGQTMALPTPQVRSRAKRKQSTVTTSISPQIEEEVKRMLTNITIFMSPDHDMITQIPFEISVKVIEDILDMFTIGCSMTTKHPLFSWMSELLEEN